MSADHGRHARAGLTVVGGPEERKDAEELKSAFAAYHETVHELKQLEPQLDDKFGDLLEAALTLERHGVRVRAEFAAPMQAALDRWRALRPHPDVVLPAFVERVPVDAR